MNAVEIEQAVSELAEQPFDAAEFPYAFLTAFGNKETTIKRLRTGASNKSDIGGILQTNNIHLKTCEPGEIAATLSALRDSPTTTRAKAKFILATDGIDLEAEDLTTGETIACRYTDFPDHFGFFLPLAGISTVKQIRESAFDIRATSRLNRLYVELIKDNPDWGSAEKRHDMNHFMARLIFCFFAEDTDIFVSDNLFTATIDQMANRDGSNTHEVIGEIFRAMNTAIPKRAEARLPRWADAFPYVNGGLFSGSTEVPRFSKIAQRYLSHIGSLDWTQINPDIFGSMIQAVADEEERSVLGMHYTSVPNILKVLNPLFLDDLRAELEAAGNNARKLANLRARMAKIRVFDPACGSGNFLVIAYKEMRALEYEINKRRGEPHRRTDIPLTNYRGIELRDFSAEIARLALIIAEYQCDVRYRGQKEALAEFLPLDAQNWITCGNALRLDWLSICPPTGTGVKFQADDLFMSPLDQAQIDFANEGGETYICGNPPYLGSAWQSTEQKEDLQRIFEGRTKSWKSLDYVAGWFMKAADYGLHTPTVSAFVSTNSICQGQQVPILWPLIFKTGHEIAFAHTSFKWANLASHNAGVTVAIVAISNHTGPGRKLFTLADDGGAVVKEADSINAYLVAAPNAFVDGRRQPFAGVGVMERGNDVLDGGNFLLSSNELMSLDLTVEQQKKFIRRVFGSAEFIRGISRYCIWIEDSDRDDALRIRSISERIGNVEKLRASNSNKQISQTAAQTSHRFIARRHVLGAKTIVIPKVSSENRAWLPVGIIDADSTLTDLLFFMRDAPLWNMALIVSRLHLVWIATVCGKMKTDFRYSNTMGWNTFPVPKLTEKNRADLTAAAEGILLAREAHFPATITDLYDPEKMPANLRAAHDHNDEVLERIYIGRRFRNDTERLEKLFEMYTKMTTKVADLA
jgi:hypothetical protein